MLYASLDGMLIAEREYNLGKLRKSEWSVGFVNKNVINLVHCDRFPTTVLEVHRGNWAKGYTYDKSMHHIGNFSVSTKPF